MKLLTDEEQVMIHDKYVVIGQQGAGKSLFIQRIEAIQLHQQYSIVEGVKHFIELIDTPSYDSYFSLLPMRNQNVFGYIIMFSLANTEILKTLKDIKHKLFQINGQEKPTIIIANTLQLYGINDSNIFQQELGLVQEWCNQCGIKLVICDLKHSKDKELYSLFDYFYTKKQPIILQIKLLLICQLLLGFAFFFFLIILALFNPSEILTNVRLELYLLIGICVTITKLMIASFGISNLQGLAYQRQKLKKPPYIKSIIFRSKLVSVIDLFLAIPIAILAVLLMKIGCMVFSTLLVVNSLICVYYSFR